jgi:hypothetical protein
VVWSEYSSSSYFPPSSRLSYQSSNLRGRHEIELMNSKTKLNPPGMIKSALEDYAIKHSLVDRAEPRYLLLDEELGRACGIKKPEKGQRMSRDEIMKKLRAGVVWSVSIGGVLK